MRRLGPAALTLVAVLSTAGAGHAALIGGWLLLLGAVAIVGRRLRPV